MCFGSALIKWSTSEYFATEPIYTYIYIYRRERGGKQYKPPENLTKSDISRGKKTGRNERKADKETSWRTDKWRDSKANISDNSQPYWEHFDFVIQRDLLGQIFELTHSPSSGTKTNEKCRKRHNKEMLSQIEWSQETKNDRYNSITSIQMSNAVHKRRIRFSLFEW